MENPYYDPKPALVGLGLLIGVFIGVIFLTPEANAGTHRPVIFQDDDTVEVPTTEAFSALVARLAKLEQKVGRMNRRLAKLERAQLPPVAPPIDPPIDPPVDPPVDPPTGDWPTAGPLRLKLDGVSLMFDDPMDEEWTVERGWRFCVRRERLSDVLAFVFMEQFEGFDATRVTWALANSFPGTGAVLFDDLSVDNPSGNLYEVKGANSPGPDAIQVRGILARRHWLGPDADALESFAHVEPTTGYPAWVAEVNAEGRATAELSFVPPNDKPNQVRAGARALGLYRLGDPSVKGASSLNGSHGGWKVAPWHMGPEGWQRATRDGYRWAEVGMFDTLDRSPLAVFDPVTLHPLNQHSPYWPGRVNVTIPGFAADPDPACSYLPELEKYEAHAYSHLWREICEAAMLAPRDVVARFLLVEVYWHDIALWLDGGRSANNLLKPAAQVMEELPPNVGWSNAGRGLAHSVRAYISALPYFPAIARDDSGGYNPAMLGDGSLWSDVIPELLIHVARPNGVLHSMERDHKFSNVAPAARAREVDLMYPNFEALGLTELAAKCRETMAPINGISVAESFDPRGVKWNAGEKATPNYYPQYDLIRSDSLYLLDLSKRWLSPNEQLISMAPPSLVRMAD